MKTYLYRLQFKAPVHFGITNIGLETTYERLSSDSLTSALVNAFSVLDKAKMVIKALREPQPPFILSSLFPFGPVQGANGPVYALPCPLMNPTVEDDEVFRALGKDLKRTRYLTAEDFFSWIGSKPLSSEELGAILDNSKEVANRWSTETGKGWWATEMRLRVAVDRESRNSSIWSCNTLHFHEDAGLYGLIRVGDRKWKGQIDEAFRLLGDLGLGGERTYGMGTFEFSGLDPIYNVWPFAQGKNPARFILLSRYYPADNERPHLRERLESWDFTESRGYVVSGRMATSLKRQRVRMITEGSVLKRPVIGKMARVTPEKSSDLGLHHEVYRSGLAFTMPEGAVK